MKRIEISLSHVFELHPLVHHHSLRSFLESHYPTDFADLGIRDTFHQGDHSISSRGTLRAINDETNDSAHW